LGNGGREKAFVALEGGLFEPGEKFSKAATKGLLGGARGRGEKEETRTNGVTTRGPPKGFAGRQKEERRVIAVKNSPHKVRDHKE